MPAQPLQSTQQHGGDQQQGGGDEYNMISIGVAGDSAAASDKSASPEIDLMSHWTDNGAETKTRRQPLKLSCAMTFSVAWGSRPTS